MNQTEYEQLRTRVERFSRKAEQAKGAYQQCRDKLLATTGAKTVKGAEKGLEHLRNELKTLQTDLDKASAAFEEKWNEYLQNT